ncbi:MAG: GNAT family N-acetyltransferase [Alphaproteobacteria bacterium]|nr:GNAT family N-acetyltransferase [Alphaproteobacteria bacterium]
MTADAEVPLGKLRMVITSLEMHARPSHGPAHLPAGTKAALLRADNPTVSFYRYLYNTVGEPWLWYDRRAFDDATLTGIIQDPKVEIYVLYVSGVPAGYGELDRRKDGEIELAYFGLMPEFIGKGLGRYFLTWIVDAAWRYEPKRLWVHSCNFDHPEALRAYQRAGFTPFDQETIVIEDPRVSGLIPEHVTART